MSGSRKPTRIVVREEALPVAGFRAAGISCGIKPSGRHDLALIESDRVASIAGVYTKSTVVGAPVEIGRERIVRGRARGVVVNSGISNVAMGARGRRDALAMARLAAKAIGCDEQDVFMASTGVIGKPLPMARLRAGIPAAAAALRSEGFDDAAEAIRTTDTFAKKASVQTRIGGRTITITGIAKGSGMIEPNMATMLAFLVTDANVAPGPLRRLLREVVDDTFNCLTVDGESSTSDSVLLLANGAAGGGRIAAGSADFGRLTRAVHAVAEALTRKLARDGEGATKLVRVEVEGAASAADADLAARRIANSMLVKTALFGGDPNWGRILQTVGAGQVKIEASRARVRLGGVCVFEKGASAGPGARRRAEKAIRKEEVAIEVELGAGRHRARIWTCDLSYDYVKINAEYTT